jgi:hypothetical protein
MYDTIILAANQTYQERGGMWGKPSGAISLVDSTVSFQASGTYTVTGTATTLTQLTGANVTGGSGSIVGDTLSITRYPGNWAWVKE